MIRGIRDIENADFSEAKIGIPNDSVRILQQYHMDSAVL